MPRGGRKRAAELPVGNFGRPVFRSQQIITPFFEKAKAKKSLNEIDSNMHSTRRFRRGYRAQNTADLARLPHFVPERGTYENERSMPKAGSKQCAEFAVPVPLRTPGIG